MSYPTIGGKLREDTSGLVGLLKRSAVTSMLDNKNSMKIASVAGLPQVRVASKCVRLIHRSLRKPACRNVFSISIGANVCLRASRIPKWTSQHTAWQS